jgi:hypothetical protein
MYNRIINILNLHIASGEEEHRWRSYGRFCSAAGEKLLDRGDI